MKKEKSIFSVDYEGDNKRQLFVEATICALAENGYKGTTVRKIAEYAKVAPGLLTHYYSGKDELIAESYRYLAGEFLDRFQASIARNSEEPLEALKIFFLKTFEVDNMDPRLLKVWLSFWSLTLIRKDLAHIHRETYRQYIGSIEDMLGQAYAMDNRAVAPELIKRQAIGINALLDGLWLEWCLDPETFSRAEGLRIVHEFVESTTGLSVGLPPELNDPE
ncbi:TetR/AcrR family transcriptional regulator [Emcibacter sp.]|uniref:TetR/AcrR family transcriptional regulator n=1 Tax=Emcibacter sp. TaxID=1979954 RepID=UPI002AA81199|nr:TetR family transcriptional regulator C-terminal domain-containing protein [Emcibacter sp.]